MNEYYGFLGNLGYRPRRTAAYGSPVEVREDRGLLGGPSLRETIMGSVRGLDSARPSDERLSEGVVSDEELQQRFRGLSGI